MNLNPSYFISASQIDKIIVDIIATSIKNTMRICRSKEHISIRERVGLFVTFLRSELLKILNKAKEFSILLSFMTNTSNWSDVGVLRLQLYNRLNVTFITKNGDFYTLDQNKISLLSERALNNIKYTSQEQAIDNNINSCFADIELGIDLLLDNLRQAKQLNEEADVVTSNLTNIALELENL